MTKINNSAHGVVTAANFFGDFARPHAEQVERSYSVRYLVTKHGVALVSRLLSRCGPPAIFWRVVAVYVDSIKRVRWRALPHVLIKVLKTTPAVANANTPSAVVTEAACSRIRATLDHANPRLVCWRAVQAVPRVHLFRPLFYKAAARANQTGLQAVNRSNLFCPAIAPVAPKRNTPLLFASGGYGHNAAKSLIGDVTNHV